jgi:hypothetical protein
MVLAMVDLVSLTLLPVMPAWLHLGWPRIYDLAYPVVPLAATICLLVGASKMRNLTSVRVTVGTHPGGVSDISRG